MLIYFSFQIRPSKSRHASQKSLGVTVQLSATTYSHLYALGISCRHIKHARGKVVARHIKGEGEGERASFCGHNSFLVGYICMSLYYTLLVETSGLLSLLLILQKMHRSPRKPLNLGIVPTYLCCPPRKVGSCQELGRPYTSAVVSLRRYSCCRASLLVSNPCYVVSGSYHEVT